MLGTWLAENDVTGHLSGEEDEECSCPLGLHLLSPACMSSPAGWEAGLYGQLVRIRKQQISFKLVAFMHSHSRSNNILLIAW